MKQKPIVLLVDDEKNVLQSYKRTLRNENYDLITALNGAEAISTARSTSIDLVITDFRMPGMNGIELINELKKIRPGIVCAILSGYAEQAVVDQAVMSKEIAKFLIKPVDNETLRTEIRQLLSEVKL